MLHNWTLTSTIGTEELKSRIVASGGMPDSIIRVRTVGVSAPLSCTLAGGGIWLFTRVGEGLLLTG